ncbi:hypothetical protein K502DRAFT_217848 [Neoconidiobolus thromboides FSU 785]|nr:hypothetical protein K502DRAFT_217848 [Neoconidiobolus thromboides FSU 785]
MYKKKNQIKLKDKKKNSEFVFDKLLQFQSKLNDIQPIKEDKVKGEEEEQLCRLHSLVNCESCEAFDKTFEKGMQKEKTMNESGWLAHKLSFPIEKKVGGDKFDDYEVIDPKLLAAGPIDKELERKKNYDKKAKY